MPTDRREYFRNRYLAKKATWNNGQLHQTPEERARHNKNMVEYRKRNAMVIKVSRSLGIGMKEARKILSRERGDVT